MISDVLADTEETPEAATPEAEVAEPADRRPVAVLLGMVALYWLVFGFLVYRQQSNFGTFGFDIGIHDQGIWLVSQGKTPFDTVRGLDYFAHHVNVISMVFVPFYWLGAGPHFLIVVHTLVVAAGAIPLWLLARDRLQNRWLALVPSAAYLLYPAVNWVTWWAYHPDSLSITPLLFSYWLAVRGKWRWFAVAAFITLMCKEDDALSIMMLGLVVVFWLRPAGLVGSVREDNTRLRRYIGVVTAAAGVGWYVLCTKVIIPWRNHGMAPFYDAFFPLLGRTIPGIIYNAIRHPSRVWHLAQLPDRRTYYVQVFAPLGFLPILAIPIFLIGGPQFGVDITAQVVQGATIKSQYASLVLVGAFLATVEALAFIKRHWEAVLPATIGFLAATSLASNVAWGHLAHQQGLPQRRLVGPQPPEHRAAPRPEPRPGRRRRQRHVLPDAPFHPPGGRLRVPQPVDKRQLRGRRRHSRHPDGPVAGALPGRPGGARTDVAVPAHQPRGLIPDCVPGPWSGRGPSDGKRGLTGLGFGLGEDVDQAATLTGAELHLALGEGEEGVVAAPAHVDTGVEVGPPLAHDDGPGVDRGAVEHLHSESLGVGIPPVSSGAAAFGLRHG